MNDTPSTPEDELEEDLELTADESDDVAGGADVKLSTSSKIAPIAGKFSPGDTLSQKVLPGDGSV